MMKLILTFFAAALAVSVHATHIVGGYISYRWLSGTTYEVKLTIWRDCTSSVIFDGLPGAPVPYAYVGLYNSSNQLVNQYNLVNPVVTTIQPPSNPCLVPPANVCVEQGVYTFNVTLPSATQGYTISHERCCRNGTISNVFDPGASGAAFSAYIPPTNPFQNNSPTFNALPPLYICVDAPFVFNYSASDMDGDVLTYSLCTPNSAADANFPAPDPPNGPPYFPITWQPPYSDADMVGGTPPMSIDANTGVLTAFPNAQGQFVIGVCVSEYRNGNLIATYIRDYQVNVTVCNAPVSTIPSTQINPQTGVGIFTTQCQSFTVTFSHNTYNPPPANVPLAYYWDFGVPWLSNDNSIQQNPTYTYPDTGTFLVTLIVTKGTGANACSDTAQAYVKIYPLINADYTFVAGCENAPVQFTDISTSSVGNIQQWQWRFNDGTPNSNLQNPLHLFPAAGTYNVRLIITDNNGCKDTLIQQVTVLDAPDAAFSATTVCQGNPTQFTYSGTGAFSSLQWDFGNGQNSSQTNPSVVIGTSGVVSVSVIATNADGCSDTATQPVTVHPLPAVSATPDTTVCPFTNFMLYAQGGNTYAWSPPTYLSNPNIATPLCSPQPPNPITYTVTVTDANGCSNTESVTISFYPIPQIDAGPDTSVCLNPVSFVPSVTLTATGGVAYQWWPSAGLNVSTGPVVIATPAVNTMYHVQGTASTGCSMIDSVYVAVLDPSLNVIIDDNVSLCLFDTVQVNVVNQGASTYQWTPATGISNTSVYNPFFYPTDTTLYILTIANYCYTKSDSVLLMVWPLPQLNAWPLDSVCAGDSIQLHAEDAVTYDWQPAATLNDNTLSSPMATPQFTTTYVVTGTNQYGCINRDTSIVVVYYPPVTNVLPDTPFICLGQSVHLLAVGGVYYQWQSDPTLSALNIADPVATPADTTTYYVRITNIHQCYTDDSVTINVQLPVVATAASPFDACKGIPLQLSASGGLYYLWQPPVGLTNAAIPNPLATPDSTITYLLIVANDCFTDSAFVDVVVHQPPFVEAGNDTTIYAGTSAYLQGATDAVTHFWHPSTHLDDPYELNTIATPPASQYYYLFAISEYGCRSVDSLFITLDYNTILVIPTAFSPNGDGVNDLFRIVRYLNVASLNEFAVFNRWGTKIFSTNNADAGWNGTYKDKPQDIGVYVWMVDGTTMDGKPFNKSGNVTLIR